jgi:hypothetical protein
MAHLLHNEQVKHLATLFNNLAIATIITGPIVPLFTGANVSSGILMFFLPAAVGAFLFLCISQFSLLRLRE